MCAIYIYPVIGVRWCKTWDIHPVLKNMFFLFRYSFRYTSYLSPFPFSATSQVIDNHTRYMRSSPGGQSYFVCNNCWTYSRHVSVLHEPCWGCHILESAGWEFWTPGRGRSAWWRHPCWMFILIFFVRFPSEPRQCDPQIPYTLCIVYHQGWSSYLFKLRRWFFFIRMSLDHWQCNDFSRLAHPSSTLYCCSLDSHWILQDIMIFRSWPIPHKLCIVNHQGWSSLLYLFRLKRWFFFLYQYVIGS